jgi:hypothetical protein
VFGKSFISESWKDMARWVAIVLAGFTLILFLFPTLEYRFKLSFVFDDGGE